jgi:LmbE family N-acetylglucosaminyl deacetylase
LLPLTLLDGGNGKGLSVLCLGAHSDDIEIGCGGTLLRLLSLNANVDVHWVVFSSGKEREREARESACRFLQAARRRNVLVEDFRNGYFPFVGAQIKDYFESTLKPVAPDLIFTHYRHDRHQDHRLISDLTWNTFRDHTVLEYEIPKYDGDLGSPNLFVGLDEAICEEKVRYLLSMFASQRDKQWFTDDTFRALMRLRGVEAAAPERYAEAFYLRKAVLAPGGCR